MADAEVGLMIASEISVETCAGGGVGVVTLACKEAFKVNAEALPVISTALGEDIIDDTDEQTSAFSTTWSFTTSDDSEKAGPASDVFVVPNLHVVYEISYIVSWNSTKCGPNFKTTIDAKPDQLWPQTIVFDVAVRQCHDLLLLYTL